MCYEIQVDIESQGYYWKTIKVRRVANKLQGGRGLTWSFLS
jgi:hypothetical protein